MFQLNVCQSSELPEVTQAAADLKQKSDKRVDIKKTHSSEKKNCKNILTPVVRDVVGDVHAGCETKNSSCARIVLPGGSWTVTDLGPGLR